VLVILMNASEELVIGMDKRQEQGRAPWLMRWTTGNGRRIRGGNHMIPG
jgi:hypothetical protein